jgi:uncharacterized protein
MLLTTERGPIRVGFDPRRYLEEHFLEIDEEYTGLYQFWCAAVQAMPRGLRALELGVGPTVYSTIPLAERFREVHLADYVEGNLAEIRKWLQNTPDAFDWRPHIARVLRSEGRCTTHRDLAQREARLRQVVSRVTTCDLRTERPLGQELDPYDLVTAHYCTECAATNYRQWRRIIRNICGLIKPGGWLMLSVASRLRLFRRYAESLPWGPAPKVNRPRIEAALKDAGIDAASVQLKLLRAPQRRGYKGTYLVFARKLPGMDPKSEPGQWAAENSCVEVRATADKGRGVFAKRPLVRGQVVVVGRPVSIAPERTTHSVQMGSDLHVHFDDPGGLINHSCEPTTGVCNNRHGGYDFVALRDLQPGDEVTYDYETTDYVTIGVPHCKCRSARCRGRIYGFQFLPEEVRNRYGEFIAGYLKGQPAGG